MARHAEGPKLWFRPDSSLIWARATIAGRRWAKPTNIIQNGGDREAAHREASALYLEEVAARRRGGVALPADVLRALDLSKLVAGFIQHEEENYQGHDERRVSRFETDLNCHVLTRWKRVEEITSDAWLTARRELHYKNGGALKHRSIACLANTLRHFLRYCRGIGAITSVPEIESPSTKDQHADAAKRTAVDERGRDRFLKALLALEDVRAHRIYTALFYSLLRKNELAALDETWIDWKKEQIAIPPAHSKSSELEVIDLHPKVRLVLKLQLRDNEQATAQAKKNGEPVPEGVQPIFGRFDFHQANTPKLKGGLFGRACLRAKLATLKPDGTVDFRGLTPHHFTRHSSATMAADRPGTTLSEMMALARWRSPQMAARYLHPTVEAGRRASRRL